jgi:hypothetical protein
MPRPILDEAHIHPAIRDKVATNRTSIVEEVMSAIATNDVVVVGMAINPAPRKARKLLAAAGIPCTYLEYGRILLMTDGRIARRIGPEAIGSGLGGAS